jgi:hypothetical protein
VGETFSTHWGDKKYIRSFSRIPELKRQLARPERKMGRCSIKTGADYGLDDRMIGVRISVGTGNFSLRHRVQTGSWAHPASYPMGTGSSFTGREAVYSPPSRVEVKNAWSYNSTPSIRLRGVVFS